MIIQSGSPEGEKAKLFYSDGSPCNLLVARFDTDTKETTYYETHLVDGKVTVTMTPYTLNPDTGRMERKPLMKTEVLDLYAEIDGVKV